MSIARRQDFTYPSYSVDAAAWPAQGLAVRCRYGQRTPPGT